jgi:hypothetical protein
MRPLASEVSMGLPYLRNSGNGFTEAAGAAPVGVVQTHNVSGRAPVEQEAVHG